jgi:hypothetical protein
MEWERCSGPHDLSSAVVGECLFSARADLQGLPFSVAPMLQDASRQVLVCWAAQALRQLLVSRPMPSRLRIRLSEQQPRLTSNSRLKRRSPQQVERSTARLDNRRRLPPEDTRQPVLRA